MPPVQKLGFGVKISPSPLSQRSAGRGGEGDGPVARDRPGCNSPLQDSALQPGLTPAPPWALPCEFLKPAAPFRSLARPLADPFPCGGYRSNRFIPLTVSKRFPRELKTVFGPIRLHAKAKVMKTASLAHWRGVSYGCLSSSLFTR